MLEVNTLAPDFTLPDENGNPIKLSDFRGKRVILYFYPKDNTAGCTKEACSLRDHKAVFDEMNAVILGVSRDSSKSHQGFIAKQNLNFKLLTDAEHKVMEAYGAWGEKKLYGKVSMGVIRSTFIIDEEGRIVKVFKKVNTATHGEEVKKAFESF